MNKDRLIQFLLNNIGIGTSLKNLGKGTSTLKKVDETNIVYIRGKSSIHFKIDDFLAAYNRFGGQCIRTKDLKDFNEKVFDSNKSGHSCNCTFFFMVLAAMGLAKITGDGKAGSPFCADIKKE